MSNLLKFPGSTPAEKKLVEELTERGRPSSPLDGLIMGKLQEAMADAQKHFPVGTPKETILNAMENAKEGERFSMDVLIENNLDPEARAKADADRIQKKLENKNRW